MKNKKAITEIDAMKKRIEEAKTELQLAEQDEAYANPEFLDIAIERVSIAKDNLNLLYRMAKLTNS